MTQRSRREYTDIVRARYAGADRGTKSRILEEYCRTMRCHRKAAIRALRQPAGERAAREPAAGL